MRNRQKYIKILRNLEKSKKSLQIYIKFKFIQIKLDYFPSFRTILTIENIIKTLPKIKKLLGSSPQYNQSKKVLKITPVKINGAINCILEKDRA